MERIQLQMAELLQTDLLYRQIVSILNRWILLQTNLWADIKTKAAKFTTVNPEIIKHLLKKTYLQHQVNMMIQETQELK